MKRGRVSISVFSMAFVMLAVFSLNGCTTQGYSVIASTATVIGVNISQQPTNGVMDATLGYKRAEFAFVPTNRNGGEASKESVAGGAEDSADVIMELRYDGIFATSGGIYQRLAVGKTAVAETGAAILFAKNPDGKTDENAVNALKAIRALPVVVSDIEKEKRKIGLKYEEVKNNPTEVAKFTAAAKSVDPNYNDIADFLIDGTTTSAQIKQIKESLKTVGIIII
jgi:hypothetical protein